MSECKLCNDTGVVYRDNQPYKCECVVRKEIYAYLTWRYIKVPHEDNIPENLLKSKAAFFKREEHNFSSPSETEERFNSTVKGFLLKNLQAGNKLRHETVTCSTLVDLTFGNVGYSHLVTDYDFIVLKLVNPKKNVHMHTMLPSFIYSLLDNGKTVWVYYDEKAVPDTFEFFYGEPLKKMLEDKKVFKFFSLYGSKK